MTDRLPTYAEQHGSDTPDLKGWFEILAKTIAVDFDGVLHPYTQGWVGSKPADEPPVEGAAEFLQWCAAEGYRVLVFSTRCDHQEGLDGTCEWLIEHGLSQYVADVTCKKPAAVAYVDDRAVPFAGDWGSVRAGVKHLVNGRAHGAAPGKPQPSTSLGQVAYEAYGRSRDWKVFNGDPMPSWDEQRPELKQAWEAAAAAVVDPGMNAANVDDHWQLVSEATHQATLALGALDKAIEDMKTARDRLAEAERALDDADEKFAKASDGWD